MLYSRERINNYVYHSSFFLKQVRVTNLEDAAEHIGEVLTRVKREHLERAYKIKEWCVLYLIVLYLCNESF